MRIPFFLFLTTFYAASGVLARGPGLVTLPEKCNCPVGSICPVTDGCYIQGKKEAAAEADRRCSASVEAARAEEQAKCDAKVLQEKTSCDSKMSEAETRCNDKVSEEKSSCDAKISEGKTDCDNKISQAETSCNAKISEKENSCNAKISEEKSNCDAKVSQQLAERDSICNSKISATDSNCDARVRTAAAANLGELKVCRGAIELCQTQLDQCQKPPSCGVDKWGQGWYDVKINVNLVNCQNICKADPKCLSFSDSKLTTGPQNCYLYDKETARVPHGTYAGWVQYDKRCGPVPNIPSPPSCGVEIWGQGWYSVRTGVNLANCKSLCFADSRCLSYSANKFNTGAYINCYLYDKETAALVPGKWENWIQYDKRCG